MSTVTITTRLATTASFLLRTAVQRLGLAPLVIAATAAAALLYSWRTRNDRPPVRQRARPTPPSSSRNAPSGALSSVRRVTIGTELSALTESTIFTVPNPSPDSNTPQPSDVSQSPPLTLVVRTEVIQALKQFAKSFELYLIARVDTDQAELDVKAALKSAGLFQPGLLDERKVIFCETAIGRVSVARQLEPQLHVDESLEVVSGLQRFISSVALVSANAKSAAAPSASNVMHFTSLSSFFS